MQKSFLFFIILLIFLLTSCISGSAPVTPSVIPTAPTIIIPTPVPTQPICTNLDLAPTPGPDTPSLFPPVSATDHVRGPEDAVVTILLYNDFQCTDCNYLPVAQQLLENHSQDLRIVYRYYPYNTYFDKAELAAQAAEAAASQSKFWEMHDLLFERQAEWVDLPVDSFEGWVTDRAVELELDQAQFTSDFHSAETVDRVREAAEEGARIGIPQLPFYLVNGQIYRGPANYDALSQVIDLIKLGERQYTECPPMTIDPGKQYFATLETEKGQVVLQLYPDVALFTVNSFVFLAREGWFDPATVSRRNPSTVVTIPNALSSSSSANGSKDISPP